MELRRAPAAKDSRLFPEPMNDFAKKWRQALDHEYKAITNPYSAWRAKRSEVKNRLDKERPGYTHEQLENAFDAVGLGTSTSPGDFNREEGIWGSGSRAMSKAWNSAGMLVDAAEMWNSDRTGDMEDVMTQQQELEDQTLENELIDNFQSKTAHGQNVVTQFLFDLASSAPIMLGVMGAGIAAGAVASTVGAPVWLAGLLGMGAADALSEMGFNYADIVTNPMVRKKMEDALGQEFNDADMEAIREKTQELLMEEADTSAAKVGIANFINPLNWVPVANKFSKLMKVGSGRMGTIGRNALGTGAREGIEEFGQSVGSQYTAGEAQMKAMGRAGVKDIPEMDVSFKQAGYEALMGFTVGGGIGSYQGSRGYSKYFNEKSDILDVDDDGNLKFKKPNEKGFIGAGALRMATRKHVDAGNPVLLDDWLNSVDEKGKNRLDDRERKIIEDELMRMKENKELLGDKTSPEKREQRQVFAQQYDKYLENPAAWVESQKTPEMKADDAKKEQALEKENEKVREAHAKSLEEVLALDPEKDAVEVWEELPSGTRLLHTVHREAEPMVRRILELTPDKKTPLHKEFLRLAHQHPDKTQDELVKMMKVEDKADSFLFPPPPKVDEPKATGTSAQLISQLQKIIAQRAGDKVGTETVDSPELIVQLQNILAQQDQEKAGRSEVEDAVAAREQAAGVQTGAGVDVTLESTPTISQVILDKNDSAKEIENTLREYHKASGRTYDKDTHTLVLDAIAALKAAQNIPSRTKDLPDKTDKETGELITDRIQKYDWDLSPNDRLIVVQSLSQQLGVAPSVIQQAQTVETDADVVEDTADTPTVTEIAPGQTYDNNYDETGTPVKPKFPLQELNTFINREVVRIQPKTPSLRYKDAKTKVSAKHKGGESEIRTSDQLVTNPDKGITRLRFMGINKDGVPYFNLAYVREDRSGSTVKGVPIEQRDIIDHGAVAHLLSGQQKTFFGVKEVGEGKKKHKVADRTYTTVTALEETQTSEQADAVLAIQRDLDNWGNEFDKLEKRGDLLSKKQKARKAELIELMTAHKTEQNSLMALGKKTDGVSQKGGRERQEFVPFNALGEIQRDINRTQSNLRKKLKKKQEGENKGRADITTQEEVGLTLARIEVVFGGEDLLMDRDYGVKIGKQNKKSISSLKMLKTTPISTPSLEYALRINGWELVNKDMDGLVDNEIEVRVGVNVTVTGVIKYTEDIIGLDGVNHSQREKDLIKLLNEETENALKRKSFEWTDTKVGLESWERAYYNRQAKGMVDEVETTDTDTDSSSNWKRSARKWFTTAAGSAKPPGGKNKSGLSTQDAINMVRQQMTEFAPKETIDAITDEEILEFLWKGPGQPYEGVKVTTIAATEKFDPNNSEHKGFEVDVEFKNGKSETIVPRWGKSNKSYQSLAKEVADTVASNLEDSTEQITQTEDIGTVTATDVGDPNTVGVREEVEVFKGKKSSGKIIGTMDTGATWSSIDIKLAEKLKLKRTGNERGHKSAFGRQTRETVRAEIKIKGQTFEIELSLSDRSIMDTDLLIGRDILGRGNFTVAVAPSSKTLTDAEIKLHQDLANRQAKKNEETIKAQEAADAAAKGIGTTTEEVVTTPDAQPTGVNELALINIEEDGELQGSMPASDKSKYKSARFNKLKVLPQYRDVSLWDSSVLPIVKGKESLALTDQIKRDLGIDPKSTAAKDKGVSGKSSVTDLIRRKLSDYLVLEIQITDDVEGLRTEIDQRYWDLLVSAGYKAINSALQQKGSTPIKRGAKATTSTSKKKDENLGPHTREGFIIKNVASATLTNIPTKKSKLNHVWRLDPDEANNLFNEEAKKSEKNRAELQEFLTMINAPEVRGGDFFVVKKTTRWSDAYILLRDDEGAPTKGREKIPVPQAIVNVLSTQGKLFNSERADFPFDTQRSRKLTRKDMENRGDIKYSSELFMQLFRTAPVDLNLLQKAYEEDRIVFAHDPPDAGGGVDNVVEVFWKNEDGEVKTDGVDNIAMTVFKDRTSVDAFIADIREKHPETFDYTKKKWLERKNAAAGIHGVGVAEEQHEASKLGTRINVDDINLGLNGAHNDGTVDSSELSVEDQQDLDNDAENILTEQQFDPKEVAKDLEAGLDEELSAWDKMSEEEKEVWRQKYFRLSEDPPEGAVPVSLEVVTNIVEKFRKQFPGSANIVIATDKSLEFKGVYSPKNNTIYIVANEHYSEKDVVQTLWHEGIGHGIQNIITAEEFLELQELVETHMPDRFTEELDLINENKEFSELTYSEKSSIAAQEVIADFANDLEGQNATVVESITAWLRKVYNSFAKTLGLKQLDLTEGDVRALLSETADTFRKPRDTGRASDYVIDTMTSDIDTSLQRRGSSQEGSFSRTNLTELDRQAWNKIYDNKTDANPGGWWRNILQSLKWTLADPYAVIKDEIGVTEYMVSRLAGRADGIITTLLKYAGVTVQQREVDGVIVNETVLNTKMKGLFDILKPLGTVQERQQFFGFGAYKRAHFLMEEGKETFFSPDEIARGLTWNQGRVKNAATGTIVSREVLYDSIWKEVSAMNNSVVDFGVKMGLLSKKSADNFQKEYYVPFYRLFEEEIGDGKNGNPVDYNSLTGQAGVKRLKGSSKPIGDPFNNLLHNWLHIIDASVKNDAANTTIRSALEIRNPMDSSQMIVEPHFLPTSHSNTVRVKQDGVEKMFNVNHELLYKSLTALSTETKFPGFKHAIAAKGLFTKIVTAMPVFKYNNLIKDTITTAGTTDIGFNLINNAYAGYESLRKDKFKKAEMLVSGAYIQFAYTRGDDPKYAETLLNKELTTGYIVENPETDQAFLSAYKKAKKMGVNLLDKYSKWGDQLENANRAKLFNKLLKEGKSRTEAAFEARDIMDFTLHGGADWVKLVTSLTPFANAMIQGKYKTGRAILDNPKPAAVVAGMVVLASLFESMYFEDDEEWQERPDWDKDSFWQIKFPGTDTRFNIPKPHEFSIVGNMTWRALDMARGKDPDYGGALVSGIKTLVSREFGIVPIPQVVKPFVEVAMNRNIFFDRDIEPMGSRGLSPSKRYGQYTSETAILASELLEHIPVDKLKLSPYQLEHLIIGYFGWVGLQSLAVADYVTRSVGDFPERPATELSDHYMARRVFKSSPIRNTKSGTIFYDRLKELEQTVQDMNLSRKLGHMDSYLEIYEEKGSLLKYKGFLRKRGRMVNDLNARIKRVRFDLKMGAEEKATRIDRLYQLRNDLLSRTVKSNPFQLSALR